MGSTARRRAADPADQADDDYGFDRCADEEGPDAEGQDGVAVRTHDPPGEHEAEPDGPPSVAEIIRMSSGAREHPGDSGEVTDGAAIGATAGQSSGAGKTAALVAEMFPHDVVALAVVPDPDKPGQRCMVMPETQELDDRARLAAALDGVGGPLHHLVGRSVMSRIDVQAARGVAVALAQGSDDPVVHLEALLAAGLYAASSRVLGVVGRIADQTAGAGNVRGLLEASRSANVLTRGFKAACSAVEAARGRVRQRTGVPDFVVRRIPPKGGTGDG